MPVMPDDDNLTSEEAPELFQAPGAIESFVIDHPLGAVIGAFIGGFLIAKLRLV